MSDNGAHKILLCRLCSLREKYLPVPSPLLILCWQGPEKQFLWWNKYAFISLVQTRSFLKEEEREKFKPFLPLISSLLAAISPRPQTKKAKLRRLLSPCQLHLKWTGRYCLFHFISSNQLQPVPVSFSRHDRQKSPATGLIWTSSCFFELFLENTPNKGCIVTFLRPAFLTTTFCHRITLNILKHPSCNVLFTMLRMWGMSRFPPTDAFH